MCLTVFFILLRFWNLRHLFSLSVPDDHMAFPGLPPHRIGLGGCRRRGDRLEHGRGNPLVGFVDIHQGVTIISIGQHNDGDFVTEAEARFGAIAPH